MAKKTVEYPQDIMDMTIDDLRRADDADTTVEFDALVVARDEAQRKLSAYVEHRRLITQRLVDLLYKQRSA